MIQKWKIWVLIAEGKWNGWQVHVRTFCLVLRRVNFGVCLDHASWWSLQSESYIQCGVESGLLHKFWWNLHRNYDSSQRSRRFIGSSALDRPLAYWLQPVKLNFRLSSKCGGGSASQADCVCIPFMRCLHIWTNKTRARVCIMWSCGGEISRMPTRVYRMGNEYICREIGGEDTGSHG